MGCNCVFNNNTNPKHDLKSIPICAYVAYYYDDDAFLDFSITDNNCSIEKIDLRSMHLVGTFPESIGKLTCLISLRLSYNLELRVTIPSTLWGLTKLKQLYLSHNSLSGAFPSSLSNLSNQIRLAIIGTSLTGSISASMFDLTNLEQLPLGDNSYMSGNISPMLSKLQKLQLLQVYYGGDLLGSSKPSSLLLLTNLRYLSLAGDNWQGSSIPSYISALMNLSHLDLSNNQFNGKR